MRQVAALPFRKTSGYPEILLVTTSAGRWIIPKGDIDDGLAPHLAAEREAFEEGGVQGRISDRPIGSFRSTKDQNGASIPVDIDVYPLAVEEELADWPEKSDRERRWLPAGEAADTVAEPELAALLRSFRP